MYVAVRIGARSLASVVARLHDSSKQEMYEKRTRHVGDSTADRRVQDLRSTRESENLPQACCDPRRYDGFGSSSCFPEPCLVTLRKGFGVILRERDAKCGILWHVPVKPQTQQRSSRVGILDFAARVSRQSVLGFLGCGCRRIELAPAGTAVQKNSPKTRAPGSAEQ